ncbi:MAG: DUF1232 domain-containing protein [Polyangiaceae bacterium]|nr:DUF1232 domain-containing protein [Polyangiaceae bacterium]
MAFEAPSFAESLRLRVDTYDGAHGAAIRWAPDVFELFARLFAEPELPDHARPMVNAVLAYFVAPHDVLPEDLGPFGLLDDLFVAAHAYHLLRRELPEELLERAWRRRGKSPPQSVRGKRNKDDDGDGVLEDVMAVVRAESRAAVGKQARSVLKMAGLG